MSLNNKQERFEEMMNANKGIIYKVANTYCKNEEDRKDIFQEVLMQVWKAFDNYNPQYKISTWLYRIALNVAITFYRKETSRNKHLQPLNDTVFYIEQETGSQNKEEKLIRLEQFISELKEIDKALILLYLDQKSHKEISDILGISESNVGTKIGRIKNLLKQKFSNTK